MSKVSDVITTVVIDTFSKVIGEVTLEMANAVDKHGFLETPLNPNKDPRDSFIILSEEFGEVARAMTRDGANKEDLRQELIQTATMAIAMVVGKDLRG